MLFPEAKYEIEFRCHFSSREESYQMLPFLKSSLGLEYDWFDSYHGLDIYRSGQVLRVGGILEKGYTRTFLGWKGEDSGSFANIRREYNEEVSGGVQESQIMRQFCQKAGAFRAEEIEPALDRAGYTQFMAYKGNSLVGRDASLGVNTKLMFCAILKWPVLVELEKIAGSLAEAQECQKELYRISRQFNLENHLVKEEPGTLLYQKTFGNG
ncbi:MAG TPA: hypothetical protein VLH15_03355 [Dehalococcoidales bacterium]|nr:hypothetical protein [Dehalococcoidales bacterium]